jgi:energy-coupling factor transporter ATP-binding protein EcfA2
MTETFLELKCRAWSTEGTIINICTSTLPAKGIVSLTGRSGVGKTTAMNALAGNEGTVKSEVSFEIVNCESETDPLAILVPTHCTISESTSSVWRMITYYRLCGDCSESAQFFFELMFLHQEVKPGNRCNDLSFGQRKRLEVTCMLALNPRVLFLDETCEFLDDEMHEKCIAVLTKYAEQKNILIVISSHRWRHARNVHLKEGENAFRLHEPSGDGGGKRTKMLVRRSFPLLSKRRLRLALEYILMEYSLYDRVLHVLPLPHGLQNRLQNRGSVHSEDETWRMDAVALLRLFFRDDTRGVAVHCDDKDQR